MARDMTELNKALVEVEIAKKVAARKFKEVFREGDTVTCELTGTIVCTNPDNGSLEVEVKGTCRTFWMEDVVSVVPGGGKVNESE